jgi:predicted MFS family arabinose efflux permease
MFDLRLLRIRTFVGGSLAAFSMNGSMFAMFLFLAVYFQNVLGLSALATGVRFLIPSAAMMIASIVAGRLTSRVPVRLLIGGGLLIVGVGMLLMSNLTPSTSWTHFIVGFTVAGLGAGMVNPPLASTAMGVVDMSRSGMASGVNSTFRQIGLSSSVAVLGAVLTATISHRLTDGLAGIPALAGRASGLAEQIRAGAISQAVAATPAQYHAHVDQLARAGFVAGIDELLKVTGVLALTGGILALLLIRAKDFAANQPPASTTPHEPARQPAMSE